MLSTVLLVIVVVAFAWNLGVHYTGAVMGMPFATRSIAAWPALALIALLTILGATFASGKVETTVGENIISSQAARIPDAIVIVLAAGILTMLYNYWKIPTSTIQILVFCIVGVGLAGNIPIHWDTIGKLAIVWLAAPLGAFALGFIFTRLLDLLIPPTVSHALAAAQISQSNQNGQGSQARGAGWLGRLLPGVKLSWTMSGSLAQTTTRTTQATLIALRLLPALLVAVGVFASFVLGANDVSNATGALILTGLFPLAIAGLFGGLAMAVGTLTWGRRILHTVAFDVVKMDLTMASAAQGVQALVVIIAVTQGFFTSMNQALIGAMAGAGFARGRETVQRKQILGILRGWAFGPLSGLALAFALEWIVRLTLAPR